MSNKVAINVEIKCSGYGNQHYELVQITIDDIEKLAIEKLKEVDASPNMEMIACVFVAHRYTR